MKLCLKTAIIIGILLILPQGVSADFVNLTVDGTTGQCVFEHSSEWHNASASENWRALMDSGTGTCGWTVSDWALGAITIVDVKVYNENVGETGVANDAVTMYVGNSTTQNVYGSVILSADSGDENALENKQGNSVTNEVTDLYDCNNPSTLVELDDLVIRIITTDGNDVIGIDLITVQIEYTTGSESPVINIHTPVTTLNTSDNTYTHNFNFTDADSTNASCDLYYNDTSYANNPDVSNDTNTDITASTVPDGIYDWWVNCTDLTNEVKSEVRIITIDTVNTSIAYSANTDTPGTVSKDWIFINVTVADLLSGIFSVFFEWQSSNETFTSNDGTNWWENKTGLGDGLYKFRAYANDTAGNLNWTLERSVTLDTTGPDIDFESPTPNNQTLAQNWAYINITENKGGKMFTTVLDWNGTNFSMTDTGDQTNWYLNKSSQPDGNYTFRAYANDTLQNTGVSETRWVYLDATGPVITFVAPSPNNETTTNNWTYINVTMNEISENVILDWNGSAQMMGGAGTNWYLNMTFQPNGNYSFNVSATDGLGNSGISENRWVYIDWSANCWTEDTINNRIIIPNGCLYHTNTLDVVGQ